jgi:hypothetical protein
MFVLQLSWNVEILLTSLVTEAKHMQMMNSYRYHSSVSVHVLMVDKLYMPVRLHEL